jgi:opacity protein-like surface antigen
MIATMSIPRLLLTRLPAALFLVGLAATPAFAQRPLYGGIDVGIIIPQDMKAKLSGALAGGGDISLNPAGAVAGYLGYDFSPLWSVEGEIGWSLYDPRRLSGAMTSGGTALPALPLNGDFNTVYALATALYRPAGRLSRWSPYVGGGLGFAYRDWSMTTQQSAATTLDLHGSALNLAATAVFGVDYRLTDRWSLGGRYRFLWINSDGGTLSGGGVTLTHSDAYLQLLTATITYRF